MIGVAVFTPPLPALRNQWSYLLTNFRVDQVFEIGQKPEVPLVAGAQWLLCLGELPDWPLVFATPQRGFHLNADIALPDYRHRDDAIYVFGSDNQQLHVDDLDGREGERVYVPTATHHDMYSFVAAALFLYDRQVKRGEPDH